MLDGEAWLLSDVRPCTPKAGGRELDGRTWDDMPDRKLVLPAG
jgi:protein gp37